LIKLNRCRWHSAFRPRCRVRARVVSQDHRELAGKGGALNGTAPFLASCRTGPSATAHVSRRNGRKKARSGRGTKIDIELLLLYVLRIAVEMRIISRHRIVLSIFSKFSEERFSSLHF